MPQASSSASGTASRKAMRKGTRSCFECRRRKKRCIFAADNLVCVTCKNKGLKCIEQSPEQLQAAAVDSRLNLKDRVSKLEAIIQSLAPGELDASRGAGGERENVESLPNTPLSLDKTAPIPSSGNIDERNQIVSTESASADPLGPDIGEKIGPITSLFNNSIWRSNDLEATNANAGRRVGVSSGKPDSVPNAKRVRIREALLSSLPNPELLGDILNATCSWWKTWRPPGQSVTDKITSSFQDFIVWAFNSDDPSIVGLAILCVAVSLQQLDSKYHEHILHRLPRPPGTLFQEYFTQVDNLIVNDSDYASTKEGIEVILMSAKTLMNLGLIKKSWVLYHKAISYCQLLGLHRPQRLFEREKEKDIHQRNSSWVSICRAEVYLSLLLGLPYASDCRTIPVSFYGDLGSIQMFGHHLLRLSVQVIDRNQMGLSLCTELADKIRLEIASLPQAIHAGFWDCEGALANGRITTADYFESITFQMWYHQLKVSLHMPLMIQSVEDPALESHRLACLEASRDLLKTYRIMRSDKTSAFNMVKLIDYQAFICSALLLLGVLGYGSSPSVDQSMQHSQDQDLVDAIMHILRQAAETSNNSIASQALQGLETLSSLPRMNSCPPNLNEAGECATPFIKIVVPYAGTITISAGEFLKEQKLSQQSAQQSFMNPPPVFTLSHGIFQSYQDQPQFQATSEPSDVRFQDPAMGSIHNGGQILPEVPFIDFDWSGMVTMRADDDWAWLNDVNNGMTGFQ